MKILEEILKAVLVAGAAIWVPMVIGAVVWAVRYAKRRKAEREEAVYE